MRPVSAQKWEARLHVCVRELVFLLPARIRSSALVEAACRVWGHNRLVLAQLDPEIEFPGFGDAPVTIQLLPRDFWAAPLADQVALSKLAILTQPRRILEIGSFKGHTALTLAVNTPTETTITTVDVIEDHGELYRETPYAPRITRHVGTVQTLTDPGPFDLVFVDADHRYDEVDRDTQTALELLATNGLLVWHDYCDSFWTNRLNRVPEVLAKYARELPIRSIPGTTLAVYRAAARS